MKKCLSISLLGVLFSFNSMSRKTFQVDTIKTSAGDLNIWFIGHGTLLFDINGKIIHIDPVMREADYSNMLEADIILITHEHFDHFDLEAIKHVKKESTKILAASICADKITDGIILKNGDSLTVDEIKIEAVPAYNIVHKRDNGKPFHPKGLGNGYVLTIGNKRIYIAGDTENIPEMKQLKDIDVAFLPMNLPFTMTPEMVADAAKMFRPAILYPYHFGDTDTSVIVDLLKQENDIEARIRNME